MKPTWLRHSLVLAAALALIAPVTACQNETSPTPVSTMTIGALSPPAGSVIQATGNFLPREANRISIPVTFQSDRDSPWAQLYVYLLSTTGSSLGYCAQNLPDAPTWGPLREGQRASVTVTGFQVFQRPCNVTGIRAMVHVRNSGLLTPPTSTETIAEATVSASYTIQ
jgi:hypothetical protein